MFSTSSAKRAFIETVCLALLLLWWWLLPVEEAVVLVGWKWNLCWYEDEAEVCAAASVDVVEGVWLFMGDPGGS